MIPIAWNPNDSIESFFFQRGVSSMRDVLLQKYFPEVTRPTENLKKILPQD
jgi:hypothetical protein